MENTLLSMYLASEEMHFAKNPPRMNHELLAKPLKWVQDFFLTDLHFLKRFVSFYYYFFLLVRGVGMDN